MGHPQLRIEARFAGEKGKNKEGATLPRDKKRPMKVAGMNRSVVSHDKVRQDYSVDEQRKKNKRRNFTVKRTWVHFGVTRGRG